jgi:hypothetical protein
VWGFGLLFAVAVCAPLFLEGNQIQRGIRTALLIVGLGGGLWAARLGARVDRLSDLLEAAGLFDKVGARKPPSANRLTRIARTWVLRLGTVVTLFAGQLYFGVAFFYVQGTLVLRQYTEPVLSYAPDVIAAGVGLVGVGLGLRALAFVERLKSAGPRPRVSDALRQDVGVDAIDKSRQGEQL